MTGAGDDFCVTCEPQRAVLSVKVRPTTAQKRSTSVSQHSGRARWSEDPADRALRRIGIRRRGPVYARHSRKRCDRCQDRIRKRGSLNCLGWGRGGFPVPLATGTRTGGTRNFASPMATCHGGCELGIIHSRSIMGTMAVKIVTARRPSSPDVTQTENTQTKHKQAQRQRVAAREESTWR